MFLFMFIKENTMIDYELQYGVGMKRSLGLRWEKYMKDMLYT